MSTETAVMIFPVDKHGAITIMRTPLESKKGWLPSKLPPRVNLGGALSF